MACKMRALRAHVLKRRLAALGHGHRLRRTVGNPLRGPCGACGQPDGQAANAAPSGVAVRLDHAPDHTVTHFAHTFPPLSSLCVFFFERRNAHPAGAIQGGGALGAFSSARYLSTVRVPTCMSAAISRIERPVSRNSWAFCARSAA